MDIHNSIMAIHDIFHLCNNIMISTTLYPPPLKKKKIKGVRFSGITVIIISYGPTTSAFQSANHKSLLCYCAILMITDMSYWKVCTERMYVQLNKVSFLWNTTVVIFTVDKISSPSNFSLKPFLSPFLKIVWAPWCSGINSESHIQEVDIKTRLGRGLEKLSVCLRPFARAKCRKRKM